MGNKRIHGGEKNNNINGYDFSISLNALGMPIDARRAAISYIENDPAYPSAYCEELTDAISSFYSVPATYLALGNGATELIYAFAHLVSLKMKHYKALCISPGFTEYYYGVQASGNLVNHFILRKKEYVETQNISYSPSKEEQARILSQIKSDTGIVFICNPNNPTGELWDKKFLLELLDKCEQSGTYLFIDECFIDFTSQANSMREYLSKSPNLVVLGAATKIFSMAGLRLGYLLCGDNKLVDDLKDILPSWNVSGVAQSAGTVAYRNKDFVTTTVLFYSKEREYMIEELKKLGLKVCDNSKANFLMFESPTELREKLLQEKIIIRECSDMFYREGSLKDDSFSSRDNFYTYRIGIKKRKENDYLLEKIKWILTTEQK